MLGGLLDLDCEGLGTVLHLLEDAQSADEQRLLEHGVGVALQRKGTRNQRLELLGLLQERERLEQRLSQHLHHLPRLQQRALHQLQQSQIRLLRDQAEVLYAVCALLVVVLLL